MDHGRGTAQAVGRNFPNAFLPISDPSDPIPGSIISFPNAPFSGNCDGRLCGHTALVVNSSRSGQNLNLQILDSNGDNLATQGRSKVQLRNITINTRDYSSPGYGNAIQWVNPKD